MHYWNGSFCTLNYKEKQLFPTSVIAISDVLTIIDDLENKIPDKSWVLYLLELFNTQNIPIELNLICQFDNQNYFEAIFNGINRYRYTKIIPKLGSSYQRTIILDSKNRQIEYILQDKDSYEKEVFYFSLSGINLQYRGFKHFVGIEWWNKSSFSPFDIRYGVEISHLLFGEMDNENDDSIIFYPYNSLLSNNDGSGCEYPISFSEISIKDECLCFKIEKGLCFKGLNFKTRI